MKRERSEDIPQPHLGSTTMFNNLHHHHNHLPQEESDSHSPTSRRNGAVHDDSLPLLLPPPPPPHSHDGATIEVSRRPRGRPPGSKNKPKPPIIITSDTSEQPMSPYVLELPPGADITESTTRFCRKRSIGLCILNGNGAVSNVTLKQPSTTPGSTVTFHGRFELLSISATILPGGCAAVHGSGQFAISLAGPQGQVVGGLAVGPLVAAETIYLIGATFNNPSFHRLQNFEHERDAEAGDGGVRELSPHTAVSGGGDGNPGGQSFGNYQTSSDVIWAPTARQPPTPPY